MKTTLKSLDPIKKKEWVSQIHHRLFDLSEWKSARTIAMTVSTSNELDTHHLIEQAWKQGKDVVVPRCHVKERLLDFRKIISYDDLETVYYGLSEPKVLDTRSIDKNEIDLIIVPGLIFNIKGYRIGFGGGYYDRFLAGTRIVKVSQCLDVQLCTDLPYEAYDIPVDFILTPSRKLECGIH